MQSAAAQDSADSFHIKRINDLYDNTLSSMGSIVIGVGLVIWILAPSTDANLIKAWLTFMLSALALRGGLWYMHRASKIGPHRARWWEFGYAVTMFVTGIGWGSLSGPLYPQSPSAHVFVLVLTMVVGFSGAIYSSVSRLSFFMFVVPSVLPSMLRFTLTLNPTDQLAGAMACAGGILVLINVHETLHRFAIRHLNHEVEIETLLTEQETIFQSVNAGIAVFRDGRIIKCNSRLGEMLGRGQKEILVTPFSIFFSSTDDVDAIRTATAEAQQRGNPVYALYRMRRANGDEFLAELSGRRMTSDHARDMIWLISDVGRRDRRSDD
jgi:PAS domain S-box-containing protein